eukprot:TRINITY_DN7783_c0_g1_i1.p1 TRINITY_DN7783_c0_g1~~TRINITY_DN7783_c0_g1_i1.p1  ORF type:complete len:104 (+),score=16.57 TRINITY_DN7783_c0_g1_i1:303-614(+)
MKSVAISLTGLRIDHLTAANDEDLRLLFENKHMTIVDRILVKSAIRRYKKNGEQLESHIATVFLNDKQIGKGIGKDKILATEEAAYDALNHKKEKVPTAWPLV